MTAAEADTIRLARQGSEDAYATLVRAHQARIFGLILMILRSPTAAEDVTQNTFVRAFRHLHQYDDSRPFYPWLASIAVRLSRNWMRDHGRIVRHEGSSIDAASEPTTPAAALATLIVNERSRQLWAAVSSLPPGERTAVILHYRDGLPVETVARALGVTGGTIKTVLFRARQKLRTLLQSETKKDDQT